MSILVEREDGMSFTLPAEFALEDADLGIETPGVEIPGRHGEWKFDAWRSVRPRRLRASATMRGVNKADADKLAEDLRSKLLGGGALKLRRSATSPLYIWCEPQEIRHNYHRGRFSGALWTMDVILEALDPWWYAESATGILHTTAASGETWTVIHGGTDRDQPTMVRIYPASGTLVNPVVTSVERGDAAAYTGSIGPDQVLVLDSVTRRAWLEDWTGAHLDPTGGPTVSNVTSNMGAAFQAHGLRVFPGANTLRYDDDATSSHAAKVLVEFRARSW